jgi:hypothetical protein
MGFPSAGTGGGSGGGGGGTPLGNWDAATNTPTLSSGDEVDLGSYYKVINSGTYDLGEGSKEYNEGDWVVAAVTGWNKQDNTDDNQVVLEPWTPQELTVLGAAPFSLLVGGVPNSGFISEDGLKLSVVGTGAGGYQAAAITQNVTSLSATRVGVYFKLPDPATISMGGGGNISFNQAFTNAGEINQAGIGAAYNESGGNWQLTTLGDVISGIADTTDFSGVPKAMPWSASEEYCLAVDNLGANGATIYFYDSNDFNNPLASFPLSQTPTVEAFVSLFSHGDDGARIFEIVDTVTANGGSGYAGVTQIQTNNPTGFIDPASYPPMPKRSNRAFEIQGLAGDLELDSGKGFAGNNDTVTFTIGGAIQGVINNRDLGKLGLVEWIPSEGVGVGAYNISDQSTEPAVFTPSLSGKAITATGAVNGGSGGFYAPDSNVKGFAFKIDVLTMENGQGGFFVGVANALSGVFNPIPLSVAMMGIGLGLTTPNRLDFNFIMPIVGDSGATITAPADFDPVNDEFVIGHRIVNGNHELTFGINGSFSTHEFVGAGAGGGSQADFIGFAALGAYAGTTFRSIEESEMNYGTGGVTILDSVSATGAIDPASYPTNRNNKSFTVKGLDYPLLTTTGDPVTNNNMIIFGGNGDPVFIGSSHSGGDVVSDENNTLSGNNTHEGTNTFTGGIAGIKSYVPVDFGGGIISLSQPTGLSGVVPLTVLITIAGKGITFSEIGDNLTTFGDLIDALNAQLPHAVASLFFGNIHITAKDFGNLSTDITNDNVFSACTPSGTEGSNVVGADPAGVNSIDHDLEVAGKSVLQVIHGEWQPVDDGGGNAHTGLFPNKPAGKIFIINNNGYTPVVIQNEAAVSLGTGNDGDVVIFGLNGYPVKRI